MSGVAVAETEALPALPALQFTLTFAENVDALAPLPAEEAQIDSPWPVLRLLLRQIWQPPDGSDGRYIGEKIDCID